MKIDCEHINDEIDNPEFLTPDQEEKLRDYYFNEANEVDEKLSEQGFIDWKEGMSWREIYETIGFPEEQEPRDESNEEL